MTSPVFVGVIDEPVAILAAAEVAAHARAARERRRRRRPVVGLQLPVGLGRSPARRQRVGIQRVGGRLRPVDPDLAHGDVRLRRSDRRRLQPFAEAPPARVALRDAPPLRVVEIDHQIDAGDPLQPRVHGARALARRARGSSRRRSRDRSAARRSRRVSAPAPAASRTPACCSARAPARRRPRSQGRRTKTTAAAAADQPARSAETPAGAPAVAGAASIRSRRRRSDAGDPGRCPPRRSRPPRRSNARMRWRDP